MKKEYSEFTVESSKDSEIEGANTSNIQPVSCTYDPTLPCLINKIASIAIENSYISLIMTTSIAISIVIYAIAKSVAEIIKVWRNNE